MEVSSRLPRMLLGLILVVLLIAGCGAAPEPGSALESPSASVSGSVSEPADGPVCTVDGDFAADESDALRESCQRAVPVVLAAWPGWAEPRVVIVKAPEPLPEGIAARVEGHARAGEPTTGDRLLVSPGLPSRLSAEGLDVVLRHELTHLAMRATATAPLPLWAAEGLAEVVAYGAVADDRRDRADDVARLRDAVEAGRWEGTVPESAAFDAAGEEVDLAYITAWLAMTALVDAAGLPEVVAAMQVDESVAGAPDASTAEALFLARLGVSRAELDTRWRALLGAG